MEAHLVFYHKKYGTFANALYEHDGLAVLAFFLEVKEDSQRSDFSEFSNAVLKIVRKDSSTPVSTG